MFDEHIGTLALGAIAVGGQVFNYVLNLNLKNAILQSERRLLDRVDKEFVRKETCGVIHRWQEETKENKS